MFHCCFTVGFLDLSNLFVLVLKKSFSGPIERGCLGFVLRVGLRTVLGCFMVGFGNRFGIVLRSVLKSVLRSVLRCFRIGFGVGFGIDFKDDFEVALGWVLGTCWGWFYDRSGDDFGHFGVSLGSVWWPW